MQFALNLEYIERAFYEEGLAQFDTAAFADAGYEAWVRGRFRQITDHEKVHVAFLQEQLGSNAPEPCNYSYPYTDVQSWVSLSQTLEQVGAAAYMGASRFVDDKDVLTASLAISHIEARQAGWVNSAVQKQQAWDGDFETPLYFSGVWSLASGFIVECPSSNPELPVASFPALTVSDSSPAKGSNISVSYNSTSADAACQTYLAWYHDMNVTYTSIDENGATTVPDGLRGTVFAGVVKNETQIAGSDATMLSGLAIFTFPYGSYAIVGA
ncbi:uncharacterized protein LAESUDRAFT_727493 [Laetiporus sulphureus 93-53]|uniref:Ferritin-like domain-containing protein n=1 Tax=Laetiporus sulphureus 93-53 TaxID=1314785 RepID=A0A165DHY6_9APHY|nr:uncharacterized protein LAESUDRAFT_727493 [Laetiporus sulphureus 93-53]KZT04921.1 hypothetical protein LAESUDRAFT_727493 [Laetiporus sulphureus 93-53]